ncbi:MAG: Rrf2 family transcriptional regulator [Pseudomonadota bacterium]
MQLTRFTDYALRVLIYLAAHPDRMATISEIAASYGISENHLMKIVHHLSTRGYIETVRGKGGGMRLARRPELINIGEVVRDTEDNLDIVECFNQEKRDCPLLPACVLKSILSEARKNFMATLDRYNLQDLLGTQAVSLFAIRKSKAG